MSESTVQQVLSAARLLFQPGDVVEVRVPKARRYRVIAGYFSDFQAMAEAVAALEKERPGYAGVYWTLNPVSPELLARAPNVTRPYVGPNETTSDKYIVTRRLLLVDCDPERPPEISSTEAEHAAALERIRRIHDALLAEGWPDGILADSGNGGHLLYSIDLPNDKGSADLVQQCLQALASRFDDADDAKPKIKVDKSTFNASRISKIYGTMARKGMHTADRPHRVSRVLHVPALFTPVPLALLRALAAQAPQKQRTPQAAPPKASGPRLVSPREFSLREFLDRHGIRYRDPVAHDGGYKYTLLECPFDPSHKAKDAAVFERADGFGFKCFHNSCSDRGWREFRELFEPDAYRGRSAGGPVRAPHPAGPSAPPRDEDVPPARDEHDEDSINAEDVKAAVDDAIARNDLDAALLLIPEIARQDALLVLRIKTALSDKFKRRFSLKGFEQSIRAERLRRQANAGFRAEDPSLPVIVVNNRPMRDVVADSLAALRAANDPPFLFVRSGRMVFVEMDERQRPSIQEVDKAHLRGRLDRAANYIRRGAETDISVPPPVEVVEDILALPSAQWGVPPLEFVVEVPTLRPDGTVLSSPGYDPISRMLYAPAPGFKMEQIPDYVQAQHLFEAIKLIDEAIGDFPYAEEKNEAGESIYPSRANLFGLLLTPIVRPAISGVVPLALIDAPQAGTGKSLLVDLFSVITTGRTAAMMPFPRNEEEMQKSVGATLLAGGALVCFDNIEGILQSPTLALVLTAKEYSTRILGVSENMIVPNRATWVATGNNIRPSGDMPRRCYHIRLDAKKSRPYQGRKFKHENLLDWAREVRPQLLRSLLIIARAWYQEGAERPTITDTAWGSFEEWHKTIAGILRRASIEGFLGNLQTFLMEADDNALQWEVFLGEIHEVFGEEWFLVGRIVQKVRDATALEPSPFTIPDSLADVDRKKEGGFERALGKSFVKRLGTRFGDRELHLERDINKHNKQAKWRVMARAVADNASPELQPTAQEVVAETDEQYF